MRTSVIDALGLGCTLDAEYFMARTFAFDGVTRCYEADGALVVLLVGFEGFHQWEI